MLAWHPSATFAAIVQFNSTLKRRDERLRELFNRCIITFERFLFRILLPTAGRKDVLIPLIPFSVDDFSCVAVATFESNVGCFEVLYDAKSKSGPVFPRAL